MDDMTTWTFPERIEFLDVSYYVEKFEQSIDAGQLVFDLSKTEHIHSSFVGFLLHAKNCLEQNGRNFTLLLSFTVEKIFIMLNLLDYFSMETNPVFEMEKKSA